MHFTNSSILKDKHPEPRFLEKRKEDELRRWQMILVHEFQLWQKAECRD
jgi:hypothetical protein